jgi:hypothetical protein
VARIRSVKPELFTSPSLNRVPVAARYLFVGLWTESDDAGRFLANAKRIAGVVFPDDEDITGTEVERWLGLLAGQDAIRFYQHNGTRYGYIPNWEKHQAASMRRGGSRFPAPSDVQSAREDVQPAYVRSTEQVLEQGAGSREQGIKSSRPASAEDVKNLVSGIGKVEEDPTRPNDRQRYFADKLRGIGWDVHPGIVQRLNRTLAKGNGQHLGMLAVIKALEFAWEEKAEPPENPAAYLTTRARSYLEKFHAEEVPA